eukprot:GHVO01049758.1.p1 GENE.GHVO01049758.1~~GHVO01049758.1.p1  ORF type:complete len:273 (+),score=72.78 GHVO01049758.1:62-880(+)
MPPPPPCAKRLLPYVSRAQELEQAVPLVSFYIFKYVCEELNAIRSEHANDAGFHDYLLEQIQAAERLKSHRGDDGQMHMEEFCTAVFNKASEQDLADQITKDTVFSFFVAGLLFDTLRQFGELSADIVQMRKYARAKAAYIKKCLDVDVRPFPGPLPLSETHSTEEAVKWTIEKRRYEQTSPPPYADDDSPPTPPTDNMPPPTPPPVAPPTPTRDTGHIHGCTTRDMHTGQVDTEGASRFIRMALSSLSFEDVQDTVVHLREALAALGCKGI